MRVLFDTNIFVSAFVIPGSLAEKAIFKIIEGDDTLLLSKEILDELLSTLATKFSRDRGEISRVAVILSEMVEWVKPTQRIRVLKMSRITEF
jgi:putative PIN family toxin of toxin-antitoxin system